MQYNNLLIEEKRKLLTLINNNFVQLDFSKLTSLFDNNLNNPRWMDIYILIFKCNLAPDIKAYDILLKKLSTPTLRFYFKDGNKRYLVNNDSFMINRYVWYLITGDKTSYFMNAQFIPQKGYIKEILKFNKFADAGIFLKHINENLFLIKPTKNTFDNTNDASIAYNQMLDAYDIFKSLKIDSDNFIEHIELAITFGKDKRMIATLSNILSYFNLQFELNSDSIVLRGLDWKITNESEADSFQVKLIDAYHFFRNVINTSHKKDIVSEIYNRKLSKEIRSEFEENASKFIKVIKDKALVDWIVTISKESKYTLNITFNDDGEFFIDGKKIKNASEAKDFYLDYMENKHEKLAVAIYKNNILSKIKSVWNRVKAKFLKAH